MYGVSTQKQPSSLVAHVNSTFINLALAVSVSFKFMVQICALFGFKCAYDLTLVYVWHADAEKMHLCVDYFVTDSPANSLGNV